MYDETNQSRQHDADRGAPADAATTPGEPAVKDRRAEEATPVVVTDGEDLDQGSAFPFLVVGIGASAGGLEAYVELFRSLPEDTDMAFVVVPHLLPDYKSHMVDILGRNTRMPVSEIIDGAPPQPNRVYILPPNTRASLGPAGFRLEPRLLDAIAMPIDYFFRSLAAVQKTRAVGIVLSGTDSDGALGMRAIKGEGGIGIVQSPETARFPDMPRTSISVDHVDRILPPNLIGGELAILARQFRQPGVQVLDAEVAPAGAESHFARILNLLRAASGVDFRLYKPTTIRRRIARRMILHHFLTLAEYSSFLQANPQEVLALQEDVLINVTRFFRDSQVFDSLKQVILTRIFENRALDQPLRFWIAGCSSGEEAYSIAICLLEYLSGQPFEPAIQIFGTDASESNVQKARMGIYPDSIIEEVSAERLRRFFVKVDRGYQVAKRVRDLCIFARQNLSSDPPFSKMDLISCRNVLIYMGTELQRQILPTFHYALRPNGYLLLGNSETIREFTDLFHLVDRKHKFFIKVGTDSPRAILELNAPALLSGSSARGQRSPIDEQWGDIELQRAADRIVLARYAPPGVVIDEKMQILQSRGHTSPFVEMSQGSVSLQLGRMLSDSIATQVTHAVRHAIEQNSPVRVEGLRVSRTNEEREIVLEVLPIHTLAPRSRCFLVLFAPAEQVLAREAERSVTLPEQKPETGDQMLHGLRQELGSAKLYLQTLLEERDAKNQELLSANEEIQSANEEMQSTNEELETTKEELQSTNEELQTVNDELQQRNSVLTQTSNDLSNLLNSVNLPVLMLSNDLHIRHFTLPTQRLLNLRAPDVGRPLAEIRLNLSVDNFQPLLNEVLETLTPREMEVQDREGHWYLLRIRPYRTTENKIEGVVVVLLDINQLRISQQELRTARDFARSVVECVPLPLAVVDREFKVQAANDAFRRLTGLARENVEGRAIGEIVARAWGLGEPLQSRLEHLRSAQGTESGFEFKYTSPGANPKMFTVSGRVLKTDGDTFFMLTFEDTTAESVAEDVLRTERERLAGEVASTNQELGRTQNELRALAGSLLTSQEDERRRVARELHDDISQKLAILEIDCKRLEPQVGVDPVQVGQNLSHILQSIQSLSDDIRRISHALHPSVIEDLGLSPALRSLIDDFREREGMIVTYSVQDVPENIPLHIATGLYRIAQEALRNVAKHAGKTHVKVLLRGSASRVRLQVVDAGQGFDRLHERRSGLGLISMEERTRAIGGTFAIESELGEGTRVMVDVPWSPRP